MRKHLLVDAKDRKRLVFIAIFIFFLFFLILIQFYRLQVIDGNKWLKIATRQHQSETIEYFQRGSFYSNTALRAGHPEEKIAFVTEVPKFHLFIDPKSIPVKHKMKIAKTLFKDFDLSRTEREKVLQDFFRNSRSRKVISWIDRDKKEKIHVWWKKFSRKEKIVRNAIYFVQDYKRSYPFGSLLGQVLHTVRERKDPLTFQSLPTGGLELYFNKFLKGKLGKRIITRSPRHSLDTGQVVDVPENGKHIYLTINHYLQAITEEELGKGIIKANAKGGWAIMMDPHSGEIFALAQKPSFDIRNYKKYFNNEDLKANTSLKAINEPIEPGSIMKPLTLAICFKANEELQKMGKTPIFYPDEKIACSNGKVPGRSKPIKDGRVHKYLNMNLAIQKSSNIYFAKLVERVIQRLGDEWYYNALSELFGFGKKTNIEFPLEERGFVPQLNKYYKNGAAQWSTCTPYSLAIGYNILVNGVQMIKAFSMIINGGYEVKPTLLRKIVKKEGHTETVILDNFKNFSKKERKRVLSQSSCNAITSALKYTTKLGGTSRFGDIYGYTEGGKSGTAEKVVKGKYSKNLHVSSFIGFVPADNPRFVLLISIDEPEKKFVPGLGKMQHGGVCAAPIFKDISTRALKYFGVAPDDPFGYSVSDPRRDRERSDWAFEVQKLKELYNYWND